MNRPGWQDLIAHVQQEDTVVAFQEQIDTRDSSAATKFLRRAMLALGAYQVDATSERIRDGQARARGRDAASAGRPPRVPSRWSSAGAWTGRERG